MSKHETPPRGAEGTERMSSEYLILSENNSIVGTDSCEGMAIEKAKSLSNDQKATFRVVRVIATTSYGVTVVRRPEPGPINRSPFGRPDFQPGRIFGGSITSAAQEPSP